MQLAADLHNIENRAEKSTVSNDLDQSRNGLQQGCLAGRNLIKLCSGGKCLGRILLRVKQPGQIKALVRSIPASYGTIADLSKFSPYLIITLLKSTVSACKAGIAGLLLGSLIAQLLM